MKFGSLFAGIGGIDLGLERAGMTCAWQVEIDDYASKVLQKHWPDVTRFRDVRDCGKHNLEAVGLIVGGVPCQGISEAGKKLGLDDPRSALWFQFLRIVCELRPRFILLENVSDLLRRGIGTILGGLAEIGYDAEWEVLPAATFGAPHIRERVFLVAYTNRNGRLPFNIFDRFPQEACQQSKQAWGSSQLIRGERESVRVFPEFPFLRMDNGTPDHVDQLRCLGNTVLPQIAEWIGRRIMEASNSR